MREFGVAGDALIAQMPAPGLAISHTVWVQFGDMGKVLIGGQVDFNLDLVLNLVSVLYSFETPFLGGRYSIGTSIHFDYLDINAELRLPGLRIMCLKIIVILRAALPAESFI